MTVKDVFSTIMHTTKDAVNKVIGDRYVPPTDLEPYREIQTHAMDPTDINDHLPQLFIEAVKANPNTIVELGVRGGESTFSFERAARLTDADLVSVDTDPCQTSVDFDRWWFVQANDIEFAGEFDSWCSKEGINPSIDVLFIDTSHLYEHTKAEINAWFPHLADDAVVFFHDTNMGSVYRRRDGTLERGWDNNRGVIRALEDHFGSSFDETRQFSTIANEFAIEHYPYCSGLTVLRRLPQLDRV